MRNQSGILTLQIKRHIINSIIYSKTPLGMSPSCIMVNHSVFHILLDFVSELVLNKHFLAERVPGTFHSVKQGLIAYLGAAKTMPKS